MSQRTWLGKPVTGATRLAPVYWAIAVLSAAPLVHFLRMPEWAGPVMAVVCVGCAVGVSAGYRYADKTRATLAGWALGDSVWLAVGTIDTVWADGRWRYMLLVWFVIGAVTTVFWPVVRHDQRIYELEQRWGGDGEVREQFDRRRFTGDRDLWETIFADLNRPKVRFVRSLVSAQGRAVRLRLPLDGSLTFTTLRAMAPNLEIALSAAGMRVSPGSLSMERARDADGRISATDVVVHVNLRTQREGILAHPNDHHQVSIRDAVPVGQFRDGPQAHLRLTGRNVSVTGRTGDGKSNFLTILTSYVSRCPDAALWVIDLKGGATVRQMLKAWLSGAVGRPPLDWVAVDPHEALRMLQAFYDIMVDRPFRRTGNKIVPTRERPQIVLVIEEVSLVLGRNADAAFVTRFNQLVNKITTVCRSEGGTVIEAGQRKTVTMTGTGDKDNNFLTQVGFSAKSLQDARMIFPKSQNLSELVAQIDGNGVCLIWQEDPRFDREMAVDTFFVGDDKDYDDFCFQIGMRHAELAGTLEDGTSDHVIACRHGYADRWTDPRRIGWVYGTHTHTWQGRPIEHSAPVVSESRTATTAGTATAVRLSGAQRLARLHAGTLTLEDVAKEVDDDFMIRTALAEPQPASGGVLPEQRQQRQQDARGKQAMYALMASFPNGCTSGELVDAMMKAGLINPSNQKKVFRWLGEGKTDGTIVQPDGRNGTYHLA